MAFSANLEHAIHTGRRYTSSTLMRNRSAGPAPYGMMLGKSRGRAGSAAASSGICGIVRARGNAGLPAL
eukprot:2556394-Lingulodinium_polyedra.AAC.1